MQTEKYLQNSRLRCCSIGFISSTFKKPLDYDQSIITANEFVTDIRSCTLKHPSLTARLGELKEIFNGGHNIWWSRTFCCEI